MEKVVYRIRGMDCAEEVTILKREVGPVVGGEDRLSFDVMNGRMSVTMPNGEVPADAVVRTVAKTGMRAEPWREKTPDPRDETFWQRRGRIVLLATSGLFALAGFLTYSISEGFRAALGAEGTPGAVHAAPPLAAALLYAMSAFAGAWYTLPKAWLSLRRLRPDMNLLMVVAIVGAAAIGEWLEAATVAFLFALSLVLESWSVGRARRAVAALLDLAPPTARVKAPDGSVAVVAPAVVEVGAIFVVRPGEKIPLDGTVISGSSAVNQAPITGESVPVAKGLGDLIFAGTVNGDGVLEVSCTKPASDTTLAHIIRLVAESQSKRSPSEQWVDRFARVYTPTVMVLSLLVLLVPPLFFGGVFVEWLYRALVLLVIACPCALVISTPVSVVASLAAAARAGVLVKGGLYVELPARIKAIAIDKTGTLTEGKPSVTQLAPMNGHTERELLERAAALEAHSSHPLARAILAYADAQGVKVLPATDLQSVPGKGATGLVNGRAFWLGSHRYLEERNQETPEVHDRLEALAGTGHTAVVVGNDEHVCGFIAVADGVRPGAGETVRALKDAGIAHVVMLTGDNWGTARAVARATGVDEIRAELLPADKVVAVEELVAKYGNVAMVGDGVNDAPALARATLGIAMGAAGSDAAIETADVALMSDDLGKLPWLVRHSRRTLRVIRQNVAFSLAVKALFVLLTVLGHASLWAAIAADTGASLLVIFNGLRLLGDHGPGEPPPA